MLETKQGRGRRRRWSWSKRKRKRKWKRKRKRRRWLVHPENSLNDGNNFELRTITIISRNHSKCLFISSALNEKWETEKFADTAAFLEIL